MKKVFYLFMFFFLQEDMMAQFNNKLSIDFNVARYSKEPNMFKSYNYENEFSFLNGINVNYFVSEKWELFFGLRKLKSILESGGGYTAEITDVYGVEYRFGAKLSPNRHKRIYLTYGLEFFEEISRRKGFYWSDDGRSYEINNGKNYLGLAPSITLNVKLLDNLSFFGETRARLGKVNVVQLGSALTNLPLFPPGKYWLNVFEPLSTVGLKLRI